MGRPAISRLSTLRELVPPILRSGRSFCCGPEALHDRGQGPAERRGLRHGALPRGELLVREPRGGEASRRPAVAGRRQTTSPGRAASRSRTRFPGARSSADPISSSSMRHARPACRCRSPAPGPLRHLQDEEAFRRSADEAWRGHPPARDRPGYDPALLQQAADRRHAGKVVARAHPVATQAIPQGDVVWPGSICRWLSCSRWPRPRR